MAYYTKWPKAEINKLTISECFEYISEFRKIELLRIEIFLKGFARINLCSSRLAFSGTKEECERYLKDLDREEKANHVDFEAEFKGAIDGKQ